MASSIQDSIYHAVCKDVASAGNLDQDGYLAVFKDSMIKHSAIQIRMGSGTQYSIMPLLVNILRELITFEDQLFKLWDMLGGSMAELVQGRDTPMQHMYYTVAVAMVIRAQDTARASEISLINRLMFAV